MKKVIVAAAGLMLVGTMATSAMAEFKFSGDARARFYMQNDYDNPLFGNATESDNDTHWNSRVRLKIEADTKGGAYMNGRFYAVNHTWGTRSFGAGSDTFNTDYAYIGVPFGPVTVEAGRVLRNITPWFYFDGRADAVQVKYKNDATQFVAFYDVVDENTIASNPNSTLASNLDDEDLNWYGFLLNQEFSGGWNVSVGGVYVDEQEDSILGSTPTTFDTSDDSGFGGTVQVNGAISTVALTAEMSWKDGDVQGTDDDGYGGYLSATMPVGPVELLAMAGFTKDGFQMDQADFGPFVMLNDYSQISTAFNFASFGDSMFAALAPTFKASEKLTLGAEVALADVDSDVDLIDDFTAWEIGATAAYAVTDGAVLKGIVAYLDTDVNELDEEEAWGAGLSLEISF